MTEVDAGAAGHRSRIALALEYDGAPFCGWQRQSATTVRSVQATLETALSTIADSPIHTYCAGRTDAGVHAGCQVVHFDTQAVRELKAWVRGTNSLLPPQIRVLWSQAVDDQFHARFSAQARRYLYLFYQRNINPAHLVGKVTPIREALDVDAMANAAQALLGEQDFSAFRAASCQSSTPFRCVHHARVEARGDLVVIDIQANAFLHHMVRNIAGALSDVGQGVRPVGWIADLLAQRDRRKAAVTAPPDGLYLVAVSYPDHVQLRNTCYLPAIVPLAIGSE